MKPLKVGDIVRVIRYDSSDEKWNKEVIGKLVRITKVFTANLYGYDIGGKYLDNKVFDVFYNFEVEPVVDQRQDESYPDICEWE